VSAFGLAYFVASDDASFQLQIASFYHSNKPSVFEIKTDAAINTRVFKDYFSYIKQFIQA
jgi:hypothetical protein